MLKSKNKLLHKALAFVLTFSLLATLVSFDFTASAAEDNGSPNNPYKIANETDLNNFAAAVLNDPDAWAVLTNDITITNSWTPIGKNDNSFVKYTGVFDGKDENGTSHTITLNGIADGDYVGLFAINEGTIKNVTVAGNNGNNNISSSTEKAFIGGVAGLNRGTITNCTNNVNITANGKNTYAGGIAGVMQYGTIETCTNSGNVSVQVSDTTTGDITDYEASAGGIVAFNYNGTVKKSTNTGNITNNDSHGYTGGIVGNNDGVIDNCLNKNATITNESASSYVGGIAGNLFTNNDTGSKATISNCLNTTISGEVVGTNGTEPNNGTVTNSYYLSDSGEDNGAVAVTTEQLNSGYVTYKLNGESVVNPVWGQSNVGNNTLPVIGASENEHTVVYPNADNNGYTNDKPTACTADSHSYVNGVCTKCFDVAAKVAGYSVTLDGTIGLNFYFDIKNDIANKATHISYRKDKISGTAELKQASDQPNDTSGYTRYVATVPVDSDQMNIDVVTTLKYDDNSDDTVVSKAYNVNKYLNTIYSDPTSVLTDITKSNELKALSQTMSTYGYYANEYFGDYKKYEPSIQLNTLSVTPEQLNNYNLTYDGKATGNLTHYATSFQHLQTIAGIFYVTNNDGTKVSDDTYMGYKILDTVTNKYLAGDENTYKTTAVKTKSSDNYAWALTDQIPVSELANIKFEVTFGTMSDDIYTPSTNIKNYSPYCYIKQVLLKFGEDTTDYKLAQALYHYSEAAADYFGTATPTE